MRLPFLRPKPQPGTEPLRPAAKRTERARAAAAGDGGSVEVATARTRARQRLVGALVLLVVGVVGFPVLFETTPRPLPLDIPIELPRREGGGVEPALSSGPSRPLPVRSLPADAGTEVPLVAAGPASAATERAPEPAAQAAQAGATAPVATAAAPASVPLPLPRLAASAPRALSAVATVTIPAPASVPASGGRFVVQAGAYTDANTLRDARAKVEKLGLKTYTQVIENDAGKRTRVRLGPFATRQEADAAAAQLRRAGVPANVLAL